MEDSRNTIDMGKEVIAPLALVRGGHLSLFFLTTQGASALLLCCVDRLVQDHLLLLPSCLGPP